MNNARSNIVNAVREFSKKIVTVPYPPHIPGSAPNDFFLCPTAKKDLRGRRFPDFAAVVKALEAVLNRISFNGFKLVFHEWQRRWKKCVKFQGEYVERISSDDDWFCKIHVFLVWESVFIELRSDSFLPLSPRTCSTSAYLPKQVHHPLVPLHHSLGREWSILLLLRITAIQYTSACRKLITRGWKCHHRNRLKELIFIVRVCFLIS